MKFNFACVAIAAILLSTGCSKEDDNIPAPANSLLSVKFNQNYLTNAEVDSAYALWNVNGLEQKIKLSISSSSLLAEMKQFNEGTGELTLQIFSNKKYYNSYKGEFTSKNTVTLQKNKAVSFNAPASFFDTAWMPRVLIKDGIGHSALLGLRPDDPFFIVKKPAHDYYRIAVDRGYWKTSGGIQLAGRDVWECNSDCTDVENNDYFKTLPGRIGTKPWNHISVTILFQTNDSGEGWVLNLEHDI
jgi:hypothetical protein